MSHSMSQFLGQQMRMEQRLTPQLIQSMAILQKPVAELEAHIAEALESNAALELAEPELEAKADGEGVTADSPTDATQQARDEAMSFARLERFGRSSGMESDDWAPRHAQRRTSDYGIDAKMGAMANAPGREIGLHEYLREQWALLELDDDFSTAGELIIDHIDTDGYLRVRFEQIADKLRPPIPIELLEKVLLEVQRLEPAGVGARELKECLLLQLAALPGDNRLEHELIENHLDDLAHNRLPVIAKAIGISLGEINAAITAMHSTLCLHPGYLVGNRSVPVIRPDVIVDYADTGNGLTISLARGNSPKLKINEEVAAMAKTRTNGKETREFARQHMEAASALIDAVNFRRSRLLEVAKAIVEKQREFFDVGPDGLEVFRMSELAGELGCDPSTVSRTVADKYLQTPRGIYPLRYFFTGGTETESGQSMGWDRVKTRVKEIVAGEDRKSPLNDDQVAHQLKEEGIEISRRTVAKYRQQLDIPSARQRREY